jgi:site-specific DNA recombinase
MERVAIYARCSAQKQADRDLSIPAQLDAARARAAAEGWEVASEYIDEAESARTADRPAFQQMIADARRKPRPFDVIVIWKFSRFARNREDSIVNKGKLRKLGVRLLSLNEPVEESPAGQLMEAMFEAMDEHYSASLAVDTKRGMRKAASLGFHVGGRTPTGYQIEKTGPARSPKSVLVPDPEFAPVVQRMAKECLDGKGAKAIAVGLNDDGLRTKRGKLWSTQSVLTILRNEVYAGVRLWGVRGKGGRHVAEADPVRIEDAHPALIEPAEFARIQATIAARTRTRVHPRTLGSDYLLSGLLVCGACGARYIGHSAKSGKVHYYGCQTKMKSGASACTGKLLNKVRAEEAVAAQLRDVVLTPLHFADLVRMVNEELATKTEAAEQELTTIEAQLTEARAKLARLYDAIESGAVSIADLAPRIRPRKEQVDDLLAARARLLARPGGVPVLQVGEAQVQAQVAGLRALLASGSVGKRRAFLTAWVRRIEVHGTDLKIVYSFPWFPEGGEAANEPMSGGGGGVTPLEAAGGRRGRSARTTQAEPSECRVLPMIVNGSPTVPRYEPAGGSSR